MYSSAVERLAVAESAVGDLVSVAGRQRVGLARSAEELFAGFRGPSADLAVRSMVALDAALAELVLAAAREGDDWSAARLRALLNPFAAPGSEPGPGAGVGDELLAPPVNPGGGWS